jgi:predicted DNA-binding transcriptional regulator AlpA
MAKSRYEDVAPRILEYLEDGLTNKQAAEKAGIDERTFYRWLTDESQFSQLVQRAREVGEKKSIAKVEQSLLDLALGFEYEEVATEYESRPNPDTTSQEKYIPVIKKQKRTKKRVVQSIEAIRFYLSNKCPELWKNRTDGNINLGDIMSGLKVTHVYDKRKADGFPSSEAEVDAERG